MNFDIKETRGEDERGAYTEVSANVNGEKIGKVVYHTGDARRDAQAIEREYDAIFCTISYFESQNRQVGPCQDVVLSALARKKAQLANSGCGPDWFGNPP